MTEPNDPIVTTPTVSATSASPDPAGRHDHAEAARIAAAAPAVAAGLVGTPGPNGEQERGTTAAQLRRFIKSRPYVPMHELRRRFELNGDCDEVVAIETPGGRCYIGLPEREGRFMGDLVRQGEVGIELGHDPEVPIVVGVFPMRPVGR